MSYEALKKQVENEKVFYGIGNCPDGTVYTPDALAEQMVHMALMRYAALKGYDHYDKMPKVMWGSMAVLDMACGTGQLILSYLKVLEGYLDKDAIVTWLNEKLVVLDVEPIGVTAFQELLRLKYGEAIHLMFHCADALFYTHDRHFDLVLGNPPYIGEKGHRSLFATLKCHPWSAPFYEGKMDYFYFFIYKGYDCLKSDGVLCYVTSNYFLTANGATKLRLFLKEHFFIADFLNHDDSDVFNGRKLHACTYTLVKQKPDFVYSWESSLDHGESFAYDSIFDQYGAIRFIKGQSDKTLIEQMKKRCTLTLGASFHLYQGIVSGLDRFEGQPCFVFNKEEALKVEPSIKPLLKPFYKNSQIKHFIHDEEPNFYLLYQNSKTVLPSVEKHLSPYKEALSKRREVMKNSRAWYEITWPRKAVIFTGEKLVVPQRAKENYFAYDDGLFYASADVYFIKLRPESPYNLKVLCALLNSCYYKCWLYHLGKRKGHLLELYATPLKQLPLPVLSKSVQYDLEMLVNTILEKGAQERFLIAIEDILNDVFTNISM